MIFKLFRFDLCNRFITLVQTIASQGHKRGCITGPGNGYRNSV